MFLLICPYVTILLIRDRDEELLLRDEELPPPQPALTAVTRQAKAIKMSFLIFL